MGLGLSPSNPVRLKRAQGARVEDTSMRRDSHHHPHVAIQYAGGRVSISVEHYGRVPDLSLEFSEDVLRRAVNKFRRTKQEHRILIAARQLSPIARRCVEAHIIRARAIQIEMKLQAKAARARRPRLRAEEPQAEERADRQVERAEYDRQRDAKDLLRSPPRLSLLHHSRDSWWGDVQRPTAAKTSRPETLTQRANRRLQEAKASRPKVGWAERREMQRALAEREESLRDLVEFKPQHEPKQPTLTQRAAQRVALPEQQVHERPQRTRERSR